MPGIYSEKTENEAEALEIAVRLIRAGEAFQFNRDTYGGYSFTVPEHRKSDLMLLITRVQHGA